jgi:hypothetical protein
MTLNIDFSIDYQRTRMEKKYKNNISILSKCTNNERLYEQLFAWSIESLKGINSILPFYYILNKDYHTAWLLLNYLNIRFLSRADLFAYYHPLAKQDLESPSIWDMKPISYRKHEDTQILLGHGTTCFRLSGNYNLNAICEIPAGVEEQEIYDISPEARCRTVDKDKNYYLSHDSFHAVSRLLEIYFRQEKIAETEECLFRLRHIASLGEPPKYLMEHPTARHIAAWVNVYDYWYQARRETDPERRKALAWTALYWFLELGLRMLGNNNIDEFVHFSVGCEIIGEFELMGGDQENYLRHLKRFVMHASISYCTQMMASPIQLLPFSERHTPNYEECTAIYRKTLDKEINARSPQ